MNNKQFNSKEEPENNEGQSEAFQTSIHPYQQEENIVDGGEFLDDDLRMKEQPFSETSSIENQ